MAGITSELVLLLTPDFEYLARLASREMETEEYLACMWLALCEAAPTSQSMGKPVLELAPRQIAQWAAGWARKFLFRERNRATWGVVDDDWREPMTPAPTGRRIKGRWAYSSPGQIWRGECVGEREEPHITLVLSAITLKELAGRMEDLGVEQIDIMAAIEGLDSKLALIAKALLAGYSTSEIVKSGIGKRRQIDRVRSELRKAA